MSLPGAAAAKVKAGQEGLGGVKVIAVDCSWNLSAAVLGSLNDAQ